MSKIVSFDEVKESFKKENYILLTDEYKNARSYLEYICPSGTYSKIIWDSWRRGHRCSCCRGKKKKTIAFVKEEMSKVGYTLLEDSYINAFKKMSCVCDKGHTFKTNWANFQRGNRCPYCYGTILKPIEDIKFEAKNNGFELLSDIYSGNKNSIVLKCSRGHEHIYTYSNWSRRHSCPECTEPGISKEENELFKFVSDLKVNVIKNDHTILYPKELDIVVPDKKLAIEYCGLYWHSELNGKNKTYHLNKLQQCNKNNYSLITVFEDEFINKKEIVFSRLKSIIYPDLLNSVYARKCKIAEISTKEARDFCIANHLQGYSNSNIKLGLFYKDNLLSVMTFSKPSISKGCRNKQEGVWELSRFCSLLDTKVIGGASKLLSFFTINFKPRVLFSYADLRWSTGKLYEMLGFKLDKFTQPNYWYIRGCKRVHRFSLRKNKNDEKELTEWENRVKQGYDRIWDCGNAKYIKVFN